MDLEGLTDSQFAAIYQAWLDHDAVLRFPGQFVPVESILAFAARFGELDLAPVSATFDRSEYRPDLPCLTVISNIVENGKAMGGLGRYESKWHTDMACCTAPRSRASARSPPGLALEGARVARTIHVAPLKRRTSPCYLTDLA